MKKVQVQWCMQTVTRLTLRIQMFDDSIVNSLEDEQRMSSRAQWWCWWYSAAALLTLCSCVAVLAGPDQGNQAADPQYVLSLSLSLHVISQADDGWVCVIQSLALSLLSHICRFNNCNYQSAGLTRTGWGKSGFLVHTAFRYAGTILMLSADHFCVQNDMCRTAVIKGIDQRL